MKQVENVARQKDPLTRGTLKRGEILSTRTPPILCRFEQRYSSKKEEAFASPVDAGEACNKEDRYSPLPWIFETRGEHGMDQHGYIITFEGVSLADANRYVEELRNTLLDATPDITIERRRENPRTQDPGATLVLLLGAPAVVTVAKAIGDWLKLRASAPLTIETPEERVVVEHITSKNAAQLAERLLSHE